MFEMKLVRGEYIHKLDISKAWKIVVTRNIRNTHFHKVLALAGATYSIFSYFLKIIDKVIRITDAGMKPYIILRMYCIYYVDTWCGIESLVLDENSCLYFFRSE
jgi:hypothetical protein